MAKAIQISGKKLAKLREEKIWTQAKLAEKIGVSVGRVSSIEARDQVGVYADTFTLLAEAVGIQLEQLRARLKPGGVEMVSLELPRTTYDAVKAKADAKGETVEAWIARAVEDPVVIIKKSIPPDGAAPSAPASDPPSGTPQAPRKRRKQLAPL
jgi:transcriptional regulator with XRE-family HTH domain